ncbi:MAG: hypothetical protein ABR527_04135 [Gemmatimonadota bacterium]
MVLFVLLAADIAHAQEAAFVTCRQPELEALSFLVGAWDVDAEMRLSREGPVQRLFVDSDHGLLLITEGEGVSGGKDLEVFADVETRMGPVRLRTAYREISANGFVVETARSIDGGPPGT